ERYAEGDSVDVQRTRPCAPACQRLRRHVALVLTGRSRGRCRRGGRFGRGDGLARPAGEVRELQNDGKRKHNGHDDSRDHVVANTSLLAVLVHGLPRLVGAEPFARFARLSVVLLLRGHRHPPLRHVHAPSQGVRGPIWARDRGRADPSYELYRGFAAKKLNRFGRESERRRAPLVSDLPSILDGMPSTQQGLRAGATPLAVRMRPRRLDEIAGQRHLLTPGSPLVTLAADKTGERGSVSVILWGPPGTGKTTLAQVIAHSSGRRFVELSAVTAGVRDVRAVMEEAQSTRDLYGLSTVLFLDEIHRFTKAQQDALLPGVENGWVILVAATTDNPSFSVISPLLSRSLLLTLEPLSDDDLGVVVDRAVSDERGLGGQYTLDPEARAALVRLASGDARRALTALEAASVTAASSTPATSKKKPVITV